MSSRWSGRTRASRSTAGRSASKVAPSADGTWTRASSIGPAGTFAVARALRISVMSATTAPTSASASRSRSSAPGQRATISSSGSVARCGMAAHRASVTNGMTGWSSRRYVSSTSTSVHHVASRAAGSSDSSASRTLASSSPQSQYSFQIASYRTRVISPKPYSATASSTAAVVAAARDSSQRSAGPRWPASGSRRSASAGIEAGRAPTTNRVAFQSLLAKLRALSSLAGLEPLVLARRRPVDHREPERVGAGLVDHPERVDDVALRLRHLLALGIADEARQVDGVEGLAVGQVEAQHHHPGDPEEDDVVARLHDRRRVEPPVVGRVVGPAEGRERPQAGAEPGVEDVRVLGELGGRPAAGLAGIRPGLERRDRDVPVRAVPGRDAVAPPQLAAHVPVADRGQPVLPGLLEPLRQDPRPAGPRGVEGARRQRAGPDEPLGLEARLDDVRAALAAADDHLVGGAAHEVAHGLEVRDDPAPRLEPVEPVVGGPGPGDRRVVGEDRDRRQAVAQAGRVVVVVVGRGDLDRARPEARVDDLVGDDRHVAVDERDAHPAPDERRVARVVGVDGHRGVAQDRLGPGRRDRDRRARIGRPGRLVDEVVADRPDRARLGRRDDLEVADAGQAARAPVDQRLGPVGEAVAVEPLERDPDGLRRALVHRVAQAAPVEGAADAALLAEHHGLRRIGERPHPLEVALAAERLAVLPFLREDAVQHELGGDAGVVEPGQEERRMAAHPGVADHQVLDRGPLRVAEVERAGDVRRRLDDRERRQGRVGGRARAVGREDVGGQPALVDRAFDRGRV